jgi:hypothetical protein
MAKVIVSGNLNQYGDQGRFETDRSTWGFADDSPSNAVRSMAQAFAGIYSALFTKYLSSGNTVLIPCRWTSEAGKNYIVKAKVRVPAGTPLGPGASLITLDVSLDNLFWPGLPIDLVEPTITEATDAWVDVEASVEGAGVGVFGGDAIVNLRCSGSNDGGQIYIDQFEVYEYIHDDDPEPEPPAPVDDVFFSRNPVTFPKAATAGWELLTNFRIYDDVRVEDVADSGTFVSKLKTALTPDVDGNVLFQVRQAFRGVLSAAPPTLNQATITRLTDRIKRFKHYTGELQDDEVTPGALTASDPAVVLLGGINKFNWPGLDFFATYLPANKKFMSWAPLHKQVDRLQEDYLNFFIYDVATVELNLIIKVYFDDDTDQTATVVTQAVSFQYLYQLPAGPQNTGALLVNPAKNVVKYELWLTDQADAVISEVRTYVLDTVTHPRKRLFMFLNSLGTYEVLRFTGVAEFSTDVVKDNILKFLPYSYAALDGEMEVNNSTLQEGGSYSSGYLNDYSREWLDYLKDFLLSRRVYDVTDGQRRPVMVQGGNFPTGADQNYERYIRFTAIDSYTDENYTPKL